MRDYLLIFVNGKEHRIRGMDAFKTLSNFLRQDLRATGTKVVCEEGDCGACSVLVGRRSAGEMIYHPINACIQFLYQLDCAHVVTIEGLSINGQLNPIQEQMVKGHGAQCGFCTPGFVVAMYGLFECRSSVSRQDIKDALIGNLCRCTGYEPIVNAALQVDSSRVPRLNEVYPPDKLIGILAAHDEVPVLIEPNGKSVFCPRNIKDAVDFKAHNPDAVIIAGATDLGVYCNKRGFNPAVLLSLSNVGGLDDLSIDDDVLAVGATTSLAQLEQLSKIYLPELEQVLWTFGGPAVKHSATLAGNIANGSPIADTLPFLFVMDGEVELASAKGKRYVQVGSLYKGYKTTDIKPDEIITRVLIPRPKAHEILKLYKVSRRKNLDIAVFTAAILMRKKHQIIESIRIAYGGVAPVVLRLPRTEAFLTGKECCLESFEAAGEIAKQEIAPITDVRGSRDFRYQLAENILTKFYYETACDKELACR